MLRLMVDSGAFSVWKSGRSIDIDAYAEFITSLGCLDLAVNLDVIPGRFGQPRTAAQTELAAQKSWDNFRYLKDKGVSVIPVFHQGESWVWLEQMLDFGCDYIGIAAINSGSVSAKLAWLDEVFTRLTTIEGKPIVRTHGFGITTTALMSRYPWTSCDSVTWIMNASYGLILVPKVSAEGWQYGAGAHLISVSETYRYIAQKSSHYGSLPKQLQEYIRLYIEQEVGSSLKAVQALRHERLRCNLFYFMRYAQQRVPAPFNHPRSLLFCHDRAQSSLGKKPETMRLIFGHGYSKGDCSLLYQRSIQDRLLSYIDLKKIPREEILRYVQSDGCEVRGALMSKWKYVPKQEKVLAERTVVHGN